LRWNKILRGTLRRKAGLVLFCGIITFFFSCGIEEVIYLEPVVDASFTGVTAGRLTLPDNSGNEYFRNWAVYYRIYLSDTLSTSITTNAERNTINSLLSTHFNAIDPYIIDENYVFNNISIFTSRGYYPLYRSIDRENGLAIHDLLGTTANGELSFDFSNSTIGPFMRYAAGEYYLFRNSDNFTPLPDRLFFLHSDMFTSTSEVNADIQQKAGVDPLAAYISMYIIAVGIDNSFSPVYSRPAHIGIFRLPE